MDDDTQQEAVGLHHSVLSAYTPPIGVGHFHRAHQVAYLDASVGVGEGRHWAIVGAETSRGTDQGGRSRLPHPASRAQFDRDYRVFVEMQRHRQAIDALDCGTRFPGNCQILAEGCPCAIVLGVEKQTAAERGFSTSEEEVTKNLINTLELS